MSSIVEKGQIEKCARELIIHILELSTDFYLETDSDLISLGLNSMKSVTMIVDIEEQYNIMFDDEELLLDNFSTVSKIVNRIVSKLES